ncbi:hypothetical protein [Mangrovibacterium lignilyticum]|uniref:hypothetical protein n=1 Tax=Mangrovibacterium lignilyticum TaxID=2668052 RepID=UPI0013D89D73|nr:hypothetical protein [Mangrovibacterium lignilyticum]
MKVKFNMPFIKPFLSILIGGMVLAFMAFRPSAAKELTAELYSYDTGSGKTEFYQVKNAEGLPLYYYRDIDQYPCDDSVCAKMVLRIYWDIWGNFLKIALADSQQLTKIGHQPFSQKDYERLHRLLNDPKCNLQYYKMDDLTDKESEHAYYNVDAVSAATVVNFTFDSVKGAVKTCYTLWKIVHGDMVSQICQTTTAELDQWTVREDDKRLVEFVNSDSVGQKTIDSLNASFKPDNSLVFFSLIELNRKKSAASKKTMEQLSLTLIQSGSVEEVATYNFLLLEKYMKKLVRDYELSLDYFQDIR